MKASRFETHVHGVGGKHFKTLSVKSSVGKLQSLRRALVSTSMSPIGPSSSTNVPNGWRELIGWRTVNKKKLREELYGTYMALDAGHKQFVDIGF